MKPKRWWHYVIWGVVLCLFLPYTYSRLASPWNMIATAEDSSVPEFSPRDQGRSLRVACYNIAHGRGLAKFNWSGGTPAQRSDRLKQIAEQLKQMNADVLVLNEVDFDSAWSHGINQAETLARLTGYRYRVEVRNIDVHVPFCTLRFGNAILSRFPLSEAAVIDFPGYAVWETVLAGKKRGIITTVQSGSQKYRLVAAHLSHRIESVRVASAVMIRELAEESSAPVIVAGDLNSAPPGFDDSVSTPDGRNAISEFDQSESFQRMPLQDPEPAELTFPADNPRRVIDWIIISGDLEYSDYQAVDSTLSDHRAVVAEIRLRDQP